MNVVLTSLFTTQPDPLAPLDPGRPKFWPADPHLADPLLVSLEGQNVVVFHDGLDTEDSRFVKVSVEVTNPYVQRWLTYRAWLKEHPEITHLWCVDVGDVECLAPHRLWDLAPGVLYTGYEPEEMGCGWMSDNHPASREWIVAHADHQLLNAGVCGGDRDTMLTFIDLLVDKHEEALAQELQDVFDMGYFCRAAYSMPRHETGPHIVTEFWKYQYDDKHAIFRHK